MKNTTSEYEVAILVEGREISEYISTFDHYKGYTFIEGRNGSEYTIRLRNNTYYRACFIVSVDGLDICTGEKASDTSNGYIINPLQTVEIPGWLVDSKTAAKFSFQSKDQSYVAKMGNSTTNTGVIGVKVFKEKVQQYWQWSQLYPYYGNSPNWTYRSSGMPFQYSHTSAGEYHLENISLGFNSASPAPTPTPTPTPRAMSSAVECSAAPTGGLGADVSLNAQNTQENLGTGFGPATNWQTQTVNFVRAGAVPNAELILFYDTRKNLEHRGIRFDKLPPLPNPFPGTGCKTPPGWSK